MWHWTYFFNHVLPLKKATQLLYWLSPGMTIEDPTFLPPQSDGAFAHPETENVFLNFFTETTQWNYTTSLVWRCLSGWALSYLREFCSWPSLFFCRPSYTVVLCSRLFGGPIRPLCDNADPLFFCGWSNNLEWTSNRSQASPKWCLFSITPPSQDCSFPLGLGRERLWVWILKGSCINFDWLIDWLIDYLS